MSQRPNEALAELGAEYFRRHFAADPFLATVFGVAGHEAEVPDPGRAAAARQAGELARLAARLAGVERAALGAEDRISHAILTRLLRDEERTLRDGAAEVAVTASVVGPLAQVVSAVPSSTGTEADYLARLAKLGGFFDGHTERYLQAKTDGRLPTELGVRQAIAQLDAYLDTPVERDPLLGPATGKSTGKSTGRARAAELVAGEVRPALRRHRVALAEHLLPVGRGGDEVGLSHVPGGAEAYRGLVQTYTTTELSPELFHQTWLDLVAGLREEFL